MGSPPGKYISLGLNDSKAKPKSFGVLHHLTKFKLEWLGPIDLRGWELSLPVSPLFPSMLLFPYFHLWISLYPLLLLNPFAQFLGPILVQTPVVWVLWPSVIWPLCYARAMAVSIILIKIIYYVLLCQLQSHWYERQIWKNSVDEDYPECVHLYVN